MANVPKGGRGKKAPYKSKAVWVPVDLEPAIEKLVSDYRETLLTGEAPSSDEPLPFNEALELAKKLMRAKKSKQETIEKLLRGIYGGNEDIINL
ncbi:hypothetical protein [Picosynechococcus sp. NKBG042902]|uniref:hypothetical protein n=1 Tax=Picosynechococcus sp. NKBG042902 TaxID=490193 RepID=UPI0004AA3AF5|nr:hypothetical protein [Picosynechococcus sp. NKBG042902]